MQASSNQQSSFDGLNTDSCAEENIPETFEWNTDAGEYINVMQYSSYNESTAEIITTTVTTYYDCTE